MPSPFVRHVEERTIVLADLRLLFVPVPKAGCTTLLRLLADLAGIDANRFDSSVAPEVTPALTLHDVSLWPAEHRLSTYAGAERERILSEPGWMRFALVRDPAPRLWSAWQSKLLLREPRFVAEFSEQAWFPRLPGAPDDVREDFSKFVTALAGDEPPLDVHWSPQHELTEQLPLTHVGRIEALDRTLDLLRGHLPDGVELPEATRRNPSVLPMPPGAFADDGAAAALRARYAGDYERFGYTPPVDDDDDGDGDWARRAAGVLPALRATVEAHARIGQLAGTAQGLEHRLQTAEARVARGPAGQVDPSRRPTLTNLEGETPFDVRWAWADGPLAPGFTGVVRVRNEAENLPWVLPPLLRAVDHLVLVDNGSTDGTVDVANRVAADAGAEGRFEVRSYPFEIARCGDDHLGTPADSVHSLTYFYNWCFSHVRTTYALKWDGDMVLTDAAVIALRSLAWQLEARDAIVRIPRHSLYVADDRLAFIDTALENSEPWGWPNRPGYSFVKALEWELPMWGTDAASITLPPDSCYEIKYLHADEFGHWSHTQFDTSARTRRKRREWEVFQALASQSPPPEGVVAIEAPAGTHVIDHVRTGGAVAPLLALAS